MNAMSPTTLLAAAGIGIVIGFLGGLLGKGGSAIATPLLHAVGVGAIAAVASPLPATIPSTAIASAAYARERLVDWRITRWTVGFGVPATALGALATRWISGGVLVRVTDVILVALGLRLLLHANDAPAIDVATNAVLANAVHATTQTDTAAPLHRQSDGVVATGAQDDDVCDSPARLVSVAVAVGLVSGLLANSGGFLLAPLFMTVVHVRIKAALATSLAVAAMLAIPGTIVHAALGHIDWVLVGVLASTSVPLSFLGARVALRTEPQRLERLYGAALVALGTVFVLT